MTTPEGSWPERQALFRKMFDAVMNELVRRDGVTVEEEVFKGLHQRTVLMAIADLAASLVVFANEADGNTAAATGWRWQMRSRTRCAGDLSARRRVACNDRARRHLAN